VAAGGHRRRLRVGAGTAAEDIAHLVHTHAQPGLVEPAGDEIARLAVLVGQRQSAHHPWASHQLGPDPSGIATAVRHRFGAFQGLSSRFIQTGNRMGQTLQEAHHSISIAYVHTDKRDR
jgi:hypothetical protein